MKTSELRTMLKSVVKEVFREELKDILLEAVKRPLSVPNYSQQTPSSTLMENQSTPNEKTSPPDDFKEQLRKNYEREIMAANGGQLPEFLIPQQGYNPRGANHATVINGELPPGEVSLDQIMNLGKGIQ